MCTSEYQKVKVNSSSNNSDFSAAISPVSSSRRRRLWKGDKKCIMTSRRNVTVVKFSEFEHYACALCRAKSAQINFMFCSKCRFVVYCSKQHQISHWKHHKKFCLKHPWDKENPLGFAAAAACRVKNCACKKWYIDDESIPFGVGGGQNKGIIINPVSQQFHYKLDNPTSSSHLESTIVHDLFPPESLLTLRDSDSGTHDHCVDDTYANVSSHSFSSSMVNLTHHIPASCNGLGTPFDTTTDSTYSSFNWNDGNGSNGCDDGTKSINECGFHHHHFPHQQQQQPESEPVGASLSLSSFQNNSAIINRSFLQSSSAQQNTEDIFAEVYTQPEFSGICPEQSKLLTPSFNGFNSENNTFLTSLHSAGSSSSSLFSLGEAGMDASISFENNSSNAQSVPRPDESSHAHYHCPSMTHSIDSGGIPFQHRNNTQFITAPGTTQWLQNVWFQVIEDLNHYGVCVLDNLLGDVRGSNILKEVQDMYEKGAFQDGKLVKNRDGHSKSIRGDKTTWVDGREPHCKSISVLMKLLDAIVMGASKLQNNGLLGSYRIKHRSKAMVACYPGSGAHYVKHVDNPNDDGRCVTAIYYLNKNWNTQENGGLLRIFPEGWDQQVADIEPLFDRVIFFWSDRRNPHEVQPAFKTRYAITLWYYHSHG